jgi:acyl dehydratase
MTITDSMVAEFAILADDHSRIHFDDEFARSQGFPQAIAHGAIGVSTMFALLEEWLGRWPGPGDDLQITFIAPAFRGDVVVASGLVESVDAESITCSLWCEAGARKLAVAKALIQQGNI